MTRPFIDPDGNLLTGETVLAKEAPVFEVDIAKTGARGTPRGDVYLARGWDSMGGAMPPPASVDI